MRTRAMRVRELIKISMKIAFIGFSEVRGFNREGCGDAVVTGHYDAEHSAVLVPHGGTTVTADGHRG